MGFVQSMIRCLKPWLALISQSSLLHPYWCRSEDFWIISLISTPDELLSGCLLLLDWFLIIQLKWKTDHPPSCTCQLSFCVFCLVTPYIHRSKVFRWQCLLLPVATVYISSRLFFFEVWFRKKTVTLAGRIQHRWYLKSVVAGLASFILHLASIQ